MESVTNTDDRLTSYLEQFFLMRLRADQRHGLDPEGRVDRLETLSACSEARSSESEHWNSLVERGRRTTSERAGRIAPSVVAVRKKRAPRSEQ